MHDYSKVIYPVGCPPLTPDEEKENALLVETLKGVTKTLNRSRILQERDISLDDFNIDLLDLIELYRYIEDYVASNYENEIIYPLIPLRNPLITELLDADGLKSETTDQNVTKLFVILFTDFTHYKQVCPYDERIAEACEDAISICKKYI